MINDLDEMEFDVLELEGVMIVDSFLVLFVKIEMMIFIDVEICEKKEWWVCLV